MTERTAGQARHRPMVMDEVEDQGYAVLLCFVCPYNHQMSQSLSHVFESDFGVSLVMRF